MAAPSSLEALYARFLANVPGNGLQVSCAGVLQQELVGLQQSLDELATAFAKVEEIRDAVKQLGREKPLSGCTGSVMQTAEVTMELQQELGREIEKLWLAVTDAQKDQKDSNNKKSLKRKREEVVVHDTKRQKEKSTETSSSSSAASSSGEETETDGSDDEDSSSSNSSSSSSSGESDQEQIKTMVQPEANNLLQLENCENKSPEEIVLWCHQVVSGVNTKHKKIYPPTMKAKWSRALHEVKYLVKRASGWSDSAADTSAVKLIGDTLMAIAQVFEHLDWTAEVGLEIMSLVAATTEACSKNKTLNEQFFLPQGKLVKVATAIVNSIPETKQSTVLSGLQLEVYQTLVCHIPQLEPHQRLQRIREALCVMQSIMASDTSGELQEEVARLIERVKFWIYELPLDGQMRKEYQTFMQSLNKYCTVLKEPGKRVEYERQAREILKLIDEQGPVLSATTKRMQQRLSLVLLKLERWLDAGTRIPVTKFDKATGDFGHVWSYQGTDWNQLADPDVQDCVGLFRRCTILLHPQEARNSRSKTVNKWNSQLPETHKL